MVLSASLLSVSCDGGHHDRCRCNALTCGCACHTGQLPRPVAAVESAPLAAIPRPPASPPANGSGVVRSKMLCKWGCGGEFAIGAGKASHERTCVKNADPEPEPKGPSLLDEAERAHRSAVEKLRSGDGPERAVRHMSASEVEDARIFLEALVEERRGARWNVVAPADLEEQVAAAADEVMAEHPELGGVGISELIVERVPGARVGSGARDEPDTVVEVEPVDIELNLSREDRTFLQYLVDSSSVYESINDVAAHLIATGLEMARAEVAFATKFALSLIGGLTPEEAAEVDALTG